MAIFPFCSGNKKVGKRDGLPALEENKEKKNKKSQCSDTKVKTHVLKGK